MANMSRIRSEMAMRMEGFPNHLKSNIVSYLNTRSGSSDRKLVMARIITNLSRNQDTLLTHLGKCSHLIGHEFNEFDGLPNSIFNKVLNPKHWTLPDDTDYLSIPISDYRLDSSLKSGRLFLIKNKQSDGNYFISIIREIINTDEFRRLFPRKVEEIIFQPFPITRKDPLDLFHIDCEEKDRAKRTADHLFVGITFSDKKNAGTQFVKMPVFDFDVIKPGLTRYIDSRFKESIGIDIVSRALNKSIVKYLEVVKHPIESLPIGKIIFGVPQMFYHRSPVEIERYHFFAILKFQ